MQTLKPCPFCGGKASIERKGDRRMSTIYSCDWCGCSLETGEEWDHGKAWNTRPMPAATDTGLVRLSLVRGGGLEPNQNGDYVSFDQAEELLAAERAEKRIWMEKAAIEAERVERLEADNAALAARIKELEEYFAKCISNETFLEQDARRVRQIEALEAKLAAAEKVRKAAEHVVWFDWSDNDDDAVKAVSDLRSALEGQPYKCEWQQRAETAETKLAASETLLQGIVAAWESLPGGRNYSTSEVQAWIIGPMQKAINRIRAVLGGKPS